jgi:1-acyl-sn-glycerol-3-phosphate acyltransferase
MSVFNRVIRWLFFLLIVRPLVLVFLGLNIRHRDRLRIDGAGIVVANHNSHLDAFVLMTLFPMRVLPRLRPVGARDYFCRNRFISWFSRSIVGIIPFDRDLRGVREDPLAEIDAALGRGEIVILFPEGTRGEPERIERLRTGIAHIAEHNPATPVLPIYLHGLGKAMPRGEGLLVPFIVDVFIGREMHWAGDRSSFMDALACQMNELSEEGSFDPWV